MNNCPIVAVETFIQAIRDSGYRSTGSAIAELVDNCLEAGAGTVTIEVSEPGDGPGSRQIEIVDDGSGMSPATMRLALQFGGSTRFNSRSGMGRYGMGLPCSSLSQARRVEVYSWLHRGEIWWTHMDVDEVADRKLVEVPKPTRADAKMVERLPRSASGTAVVLRNCDRLDFRRTTTVVNKLHASLGRMFQHWITDGTVIRINGENVVPIDPLFLHTDSPLSGASAFGPPLEFPVRIPDSTATSTIKVLFSEFPVARWQRLSNEDKGNYGISKGAGVSVLRAGREIDCGWFFMGNKRKENYDDWWRCQVQFDPVLDELFGVTHTKQRINPTEPLLRILTPHLEPVARELNSRVRRAFLHARDIEAHSSAGRRAEAADVYLAPPARGAGRNGAGHGKETPVRTTHGLKYRITTEELDHDNFFDPTLSREQVDVRINQAHKFYDRVYAPLAASSDPNQKQQLRTLQLLLLSYARAECTGGRNGDRESLAQLRARWSQTLNAFLD